MNIELIVATAAHKPLVENLMQLYVYDFSEFLSYDVNSDGLFPAYPGLDEYWQSGHEKYPYLFLKNGNYIGFALVDSMKTDATSFSMKEFFVLRKYRREGAGKYIAKEIFSRHKGQWEIKQRENNEPAQQFWVNAIQEYTSGRFSDQFENGRRVQRFSNENIF